MRRLINQRPSRAGRVFMGALPFLLAIAAYTIAAAVRNSDGPDKLIPGMSAFLSAMSRLMFTTDKASGTYLFWADTAASLARLGVGLGLSALIGLVLGVLIGFIPWLRATFEPFIAALSLVPPLAMLPILFIIFGLGELSKAVLTIFGIAPFILRDIVLRVSDIPREQIIKAQTLGASTWQMLIGLVLPQVLPRLIASVRLSLGSAWLFVIAAEAITAEAGLGYRIFLVRRYLAMDVILPYVAWITLLAFQMDYALRRLHDSIAWVRHREG
jgi:NitT/TauT family transport system permease protein